MSIHLAETQTIKESLPRDEKRRDFPGAEMITGFEPAPEGTIG